MSDSVWPHRWQPTRLPDPWDSPGKNTEVGCHFLLQCMKVKSQSEVAQSCLTLRNPMDCSLPGSPIHGIFQARVLEWGAISSVYSHHLFLISSVSIRSILSFIVPTFAWNVPLVSLIFLKRSLVSPILLFSCIVCIVHLGRLSYLSLLFFGTLHSYGYIFPFLLANGSDGKESACSVGDLGSTPGSGREWQPTPVFLPGKFHEQRSLAGYSPWGCKDLDTTEQLSSSR